jgi:HAMP domain-containing protein
MRLRLRLAVWYAALFAVCGAVLLAVAYRVVSASADTYDRDVAAVVKRGERDLQRRERARGIPVTPMDPRAAPLSQAQRTIRADAQRAARVEQRRTIARGFAGALGALTLLSLAAGWIVAGRVLRPIARINATARRVAAGERHERIAANGEISVRPHPNGGLTVAVSLPAP